MRTTIDMPNALMKRVKLAAARRNTTFKALVVDALERTLDDMPASFQLEDASVGPSADEQARVANSVINDAIHSQRDQQFTQ